MGIKLNLGASPIWNKEGWHVLDHKLTKTEGFSIAGKAETMDLEDDSCDVVFCSHVFEHIPHTRLPIVLSEINRVLKPSGLLRVLTPNLKKIATAYVNGDEDFFAKAKEEDPSIRTDLGLGGMLMNFIVSPGQDTILCDREVSEFIAGYAHLYSYDFLMLSEIMSKLGFGNIRESGFLDSSLKELQEPLHVEHLPPIWENMSKNFYRRNGLVHELVDGIYNINFTITGFDRDPLTSLIVECSKEKYIGKKEAHKLFNMSTDNYNRYAYSLLKDNSVTSALDEKNITVSDLIQQSENNLFSY